VLLKNDGALLPLRATQGGGAKLRVAMIGPHANSTQAKADPWRTCLSHRVGCLDRWISINERRWGGCASGGICA
jgi:hypothetical protein